MSLPMVTVTARLKDQQGNPLAGAIIRLKLSCIEKYQGIVVPRESVWTTDENGVANMHVFPNELGSERSEYHVHITAGPDKVSSCGCHNKPSSAYFSPLRFDVHIPNTDCNLMDLVNLPPFPRRGPGEVLPNEVANYAYQSAQSADVAHGYAQQAESIRDDVSSRVSLAESHKNAAQAAQRAAEAARDSFRDAKVDAENAIRSFETSVTQRTEQTATRIQQEAISCINTEKNLAVGLIRDEAQTQLTQAKTAITNARTESVNAINNRREESLHDIDSARIDAKEQLNEIASQYDIDFNTQVERAQSEARRSACSAKSSALSAAKSCECADYAKRTSKDIYEALKHVAVEQILSDDIVQDATQLAVLKASEAKDSANEARISSIKAKENEAEATKQAADALEYANQARDSAAQSKTQAEQSKAFSQSSHNYAQDSLRHATDSREYSEQSHRYSGLAQTFSSQAEQAAVTATEQSLIAVNKANQVADSVAQARNAANEANASKNVAVQKAAEAAASAVKAEDLAIGVISQEVLSTVVEQTTNNVITVISELPVKLEDLILSMQYRTSNFTQTLILQSLAIDRARQDTQKETDSIRKDFDEKITDIVIDSAYQDGIHALTDLRQEKAIQDLNTKVERHRREIDCQIHAEINGVQKGLESVYDKFEDIEIDNAKQKSAQSLINTHQELSIYKIEKDVKDSVQELRQEVFDKFQDVEIDSAKQKALQSLINTDQAKNLVDLEREVDNKIQNIEVDIAYQKAAQTSLNLRQSLKIDAVEQAVERKFQDIDINNAKYKAVQDNINIRQTGQISEILSRFNDKEISDIWKFSVLSYIDTLQGNEILDLTEKAVDSLLNNIVNGLKICQVQLKRMVYDLKSYIDNRQRIFEISGLRLPDGSFINNTDITFVGTDGETVLPLTGIILYRK